MLKYLFLRFLFFGFISCTLYKRDYALRNYYTLRTTTPNDIDQIITLLDVRFEGKVGELENYYWISVPKDRGENHLSNLFKKLKKRDLATIQDIQPQVPSRRIVKRSLPDTVLQQELFLYQQDAKKRLSIGDPGFDRQWHLVINPPYILYILLG